MSLVGEYIQQGEEAVDVVDHVFRLADGQVLEVVHHVVEVLQVTTHDLHICIQHCYQQSQTY